MASFCVFCSPFLFSAVTIGFDAATYTFNETDGTVSRPVRVSVQGSNTLERDVVVIVQTADGTATGEALFSYTDIVDVLFMIFLPPPIATDYTSVTMVLTFNAVTATQTMMIPIIGDNVVEGTESFTVSLTTGDSAIMLIPHTATVTIQDDDSKI